MFTSTRAAFAQPGPVVGRSPASLLLCSPPTPRRHRHQLRSPFAFGLPLGERRGSPRFLGRPLRACRGQRPRRVRCPLAPWTRTTMLPSGNASPWALGTSAISGLHSHGPPVRVPTHRPTRYRLPAARLATELLGCGLCSDGIRTRWTTYPRFKEFRCSFPRGPALPGRTASWRFPSRLRGSIPASYAAASASLFLKVQVKHRMCVPDLVSFLTRNFAPHSGHSSAMGRSQVTKSQPFFE